MSKDSLGPVNPGKTNSTELDPVLAEKLSTTVTTSGTGATDPKTTNVKPKRFTQLQSADTKTAAQGLGVVTFGGKLKDTYLEIGEGLYTAPTKFTSEQKESVVLGSNRIADPGFQ